MRVAAILASLLALGAVVGERAAYVTTSGRVASVHRAHTLVADGVVVDTVDVVTAYESLTTAGVECTANVTYHAIFNTTDTYIDVVRKVPRVHYVCRRWSECGCRVADATASAPPFAELVSVQALAAFATAVAAATVGARCVK